MEHGIEGPDIVGQWSVELDSHLTILEVHFLEDLSARVQAQVFRFLQDGGCN